MTKYKEQMERYEVYVHDRYFPIEADGKIQAFKGMKQRPAAESKARQAGYGLYDWREDKVLMEPDVEKRIENLTNTKKSHQKRVIECDIALTDIRHYQIAHK